MHKDLVGWPDDSEIETITRIMHGELRVVHTQRKRKLQRKGVRCWYFPYFGAYLWKPSPKVIS